MPDFKFTGLTGRFYPESRDSYGVLLSTVHPGDVLELDEAPDGFWTPYEGAPEGSTAEGDAPEPAEPQPDPPAVTEPAE